MENALGLVFGLLVIWNPWKTPKGYCNLGVTCGLRYPLASFGASPAKVLPLFIGLCFILSLVHKLLKVKHIQTGQGGPSCQEFGICGDTGMSWGDPAPGRSGIAGNNSWGSISKAKVGASYFKRLTGIYWKRLGHAVLLLSEKVAETLIPPVATKEPSSSQCGSGL